MNTKYVCLLLTGTAILCQISDATSACIPVTGVSRPISAPGWYCLTRDIVSTTGDGIVIKANNVTLDFAGHKLSTTVIPNPATRPKFLMFGVDASYNQSITIMNGTIQGFTDGIVLGEQVTTPNPGNYYVNNMKILNTGSPGRAVGIFEATGSNVTITNNIISNVTGGSVALGTGGDAFAMMIHGASGASSPGRIVIKDNKIDHVTATYGGGDADGILVEGSNETLVNGNVVTEITVPSNPFGQTAHGLNVVSVATEGLVEVGNNYVWNNTAVMNSTGIRVNNALINVFVRDSVIGGFNTGLDLGGECVPFYLYNSISGAVTPYLVTGTQTPCGQGTKGPGNNP